MNILITGVGGTIGSELASLYNCDNNSVTGVYRNRKPSTPTSLNKLIHQDLAEKWQIDGDYDLIIHAAAETHISINPTFTSYIRSNIEASLQLIEYIKQSPPKFIVLLSTISVYGEISDPILTEETPFRAVGAYGTTKYLAEQIISSTNVPVLILRMPGVVCPHNYGPWIGKITHQFMNNTPVNIFNSTGLFNNIIDCLELKNIINSWGRTAPASCTVINVASSLPIPIFEVAKLIKGLTKSSSEIIEQNKVAQNSFYISIERLFKKCQVAPASTQDIITRYVSGCLDKSTNSLHFS